ncbi:MAG: gliding motility-associated C-terminal domain-containing protein [Bacteroidota bacterium]
MKKFYIVVLFLLLGYTFVAAQDDCCTALPLDGPAALFIPSSAGNGNFEDLSGCSCLATNEHDSYWFAFECTSSGTFEMMITPENLSADFDFALYSDGCPCDNHTLVVSCDYTGPITPPGPFVETGISSNPTATFGVPGITEWQPTVTLDAGTTYYIIADNITTNGAGFDIEFAGTAGMGPPPGIGPPPPPEPLTGETAPCPGVPFNYFVPDDPSFEYEWTVDPAGPVIAGNGTNSVDITYEDPGLYTICVTASTGCAESPPNCLPVFVNNILGDLVEDIVCLDEPYEAADGQIFFDPGLYEMVFTNYQGCDSLVPLLLDLVIVPPTIFVEELCDGDCTTFAGETLCQTGVYEEVLESVQGCDSTITLNLIIIPNDAVINGAGSISCDGTPVILNGTSSIGGSNMQYEWTDENGMVVGNTPILEVTVPGDYTLTISSEVGSNICIDSETATVEAANDPPENITATGGTLTCDSTSVTLMANSDTPGVTYEWTGPGGFTSTEQNPMTSAIGVYNLVVTGPNGCTGEEIATVDGDSDVPDASADGGTLDCSTNDIDLAGNSNTPGVTYAWEGPNGFTSNMQNPTVANPGTYTLTVTSPNGCSAQAIATVDEDNTEPDALATGGEIDCLNPNLTITGESMTPNVTYSWTGPNGFTSTDQNPTVNQGGTYTLTVTGPNGCTSTADAEVEQDADLPNASADGGLIDCENPMLDLMGNSTTPGVTFAWVGPNGFTSMEQNPEISEQGTYTLTVTSANGCTATAEAIVNDDFAVPDASAAGGTVTCTAGSIVLIGNSTTPNVTYSWTGPGGNVFNEQNPTVSQTGTYTLMVTAANGCTETATADVLQDAGVPDADADGGTLDCSINAVTIEGSSITPGVTYEWTGPNGFTSNNTMETVTVPGDYILTVTAPNDCTSQATAVVILDNALPDFEATGGTLDCEQTSINLSSTINTLGSTFQWTGPNGFTSAEPAPAVSEAGNYTLTVTGPNGCVADSVAIVLEDADLPNASATGGTFDCNFPDVVLQGFSTTPGVTFEWIGPNGFMTDVLDTAVTVAGDYILTVTATNGCTSTAIAEVQSDLIPPTDVDATGGILTCEVVDLQLMGSTSTTNVQYFWSGPNGFASFDQNPTITDPGSYLLVVTSENGCEDSDQAVVGEDITPPQIMAQGAAISCLEPSVQIMGSSPTQGVSYSWTGPNGFTSNDQNPMVSEGGDYILEVTAPNGCVSQETAFVDADFDEPENVMAIGGTLTCTAGTLSISASSTSPNVTFEWTGPNGFTGDQSSVDVTESGIYTVVVTGENGCTSTVEAEVLNDSNAPTAIADGGEVTCTNPSVALNGQSNSAITFQWVGPNGFTSDEVNPTVTEAGTYTLTVTASNGCTNSTEVEVVVNNDDPTVSATGGVITCQQPDVTLQGDSPTVGVTYSWAGPGGYTSTDQNPVVNVGGFYTLTVTGINGCTSTAEVEVELDADVPTATATGGTIDCINSDVQLIGSADQPVVTWEWTGPNGFTSNEQNPIITTGGQYTLTITTGNGCSASDFAEVDENILLPNVVISPANLLTCDNETTTLDATGSDSGPDFTFAWSTVDGNFLSGQNTLSPEVNEAGTYELSITSNVNGCSNTATIEVEASSDTPSGLTIITDEAFCFGENNGSAVVQEVTGGTLPYSYSLDNGPFSPNNTFIGLAPGSYQVVIQDDFGCEYTESFDIAQPNEIQLDLTAVGLTSSAVTLGESVDLVAGLNISAADVAAVNWTPVGIDANCTAPCLTLNIVPDQTQTYTVTVVDQAGCTATDALLIPVDQSRPVFVPNAFSPNNDGLNDALVVFGSNSVSQVKSFLIFSRWGETVFESYGFPHSDFDYGWDGTFRGDIMDVGVYTWFAEIEFVDGEVIMLQGDVTLIR